MLEKSSARYRAEYFAKNPPEEIPRARVAAKPTPEESQTIQVLLKDFREMKEHVKDLGVGVKATLDYLAKEFLTNQEEASAYDPLLRSELGDDVYGQLDFGTRRALALGELHYHRNKEPDG
jgi:hypothetical protein